MQCENQRTHNESNNSVNELVTSNPPSEPSLATDATRSPIPKPDSFRVVNPLTQVEFESLMQEAAQDQILIRQLLAADKRST